MLVIVTLVAPLVLVLVLLAPLVVSEEGARRRARRDVRASRVALVARDEDVSHLLARGDVVASYLAPLARGEVRDLAHARDLACDARALLLSSRDEVRAS